MKLPKKYIDSFLVLMPFILVYVGAIYQNMNPSITSLLKMSGFAYMAIYVVLKRQVNRNLFIGLLVFLPFLIYGILNSFYIVAGIGDAIRYLFPVVVLFYSYSIKEYFPLLLKFVIFFVVINFLMQFINYYYYLKGVKQWFYYTTSDGFVYVNMTSGILRATGIVVLFAFFGFFNMIAFFLIHKFYNGKYKNILLGITVFGILASISYKTIGTFVFFLMIYFYKHISKFIIGIGISAAIIFIAFPTKIVSFIKDINVRIDLYLTSSNSTRSQSYQVMFDEISKGNLLGEGIGAFGGPASIQYNSPYYQEVFFNWIDTKWMELPTTDTYPPHAFVELGIIGALIYFALLCIPLFRKYLNGKMKLVIFIYAALFIDMLFSFSLNSLEFLLFSFVFIYPIFYHKDVADA